MRKPKIEKPQRVTLYLPTDLVRRARHAGLDTDRSLSDLAREGLERVLAGRGCEEDSLHLVTPQVTPE